MKKRNQLTHAQRLIIEEANESLIELNSLIQDFMGSWDYGDKLDTYYLRVLKSRLEDAVLKMEAVDKMAWWL